MTDNDLLERKPAGDKVEALSRKPNKRIEKLFILPGMDGTGLLLKPFVEALGRRVEPQLFDYPTDTIQSYEEIINNVGAVLPGNGENFAILAESFAGPIALSLAAKGIQGLRALILVVTFAATPRHPLLPLTHALPMPKLLSLPVPRRFAQRIMLGGDPPEGTMDKLLETFYMISPEVLASRLDEMRKLSLDLKEIDLPAMYIQATNDLLLPDNALRDLKPLVPRLEIHRIEGPHLVLDTQPTTCARLVAGFLDSLE